MADIKEESNYEIIGYAPYVPRNLIAKVIRVGDLIQEPLRSAMVSLIEVLPISFQGFHQNLIVSGQGSPGNELRVELGPIRPSCTYNEKTGRPIQKALTAAAEEYVKNKSTLDVVFIEPDASGTKVVAAWFCKNLYPSAIKGPDSAKYISRIPDESDHAVEVSFSCDTSCGKVAEAIACTVLAEINANDGISHGSDGASIAI